MRANIREMFMLNSQLAALIEQGRAESTIPRPTELFFNTKEFHDGNYANFIDELAGQRRLLHSQTSESKR